VLKALYHLWVTVTQRITLSSWLDCIIFGANGFSQPLQPGCVVSLLGQLQLDDYRGNGAVQFVVEDALISD